MPLTENCWNFSEASLTKLPELGLTDYVVDKAGVCHLIGKCTTGLILTNIYRSWF